MSRVVISIDPGLHSGICIMDKLGVFWSGPVEIGDASDLKLTRKQIEARTPTEVMTEAVAWKASSYKKCPKYHAGVLIGALGLQNLPLSFVGPGTWRRDVIGDSKADKEAASVWVMSKYGVAPANHDEAEAICIAHWAFYCKGNK